MFKFKTKVVQLTTILTLFVAASAVQAHGTAQPETDKLEKIIAGKHRTAEFMARDKYRHPLETLKFFGTFRYRPKESTCFNFSHVLIEIASLHTNVKIM